MAMTSAPNGKLLTTAAQTLYTNSADSGQKQTVSVRFVNVAGNADHFISACEWLDASAANAVNPIAPVNAPVKAGDGLEILKVLEPGDSIRASASANSVVHATPEVQWTEPV